MRIAPLLAIAFALPALAQQSASYRLEEHTANAGGRPLAGSGAASTTYTISMDSVGAPLARTQALASASYRMDVGFAAEFRPPGEVATLSAGPAKSILAWSSEPSVGDYTLYRDALTALNGTTWGTCLRSDLTATTATDTAVPGSGRGYFYLVAARNRLGEEGPLGSASDSTPREPAAPCP